MSLADALSVSRRAMLGFVAMGLFWGSFAAQVPALKAAIGADDALFGLLLLGSPLGLVCTLWIAPGFDRRMGSLSLPLAVALLALCYLLPGLVASPVGFFATMLLLGLTSGLLDIVSNSRVSELEAQTGRPLMNANHGMFSVAYAISAVATGLGREAGLHPFAIFAVLVALVLLATPFMRMPVHPIDHVARRAIALPSGIVLICGGIVLAAFFVEAVVESWSALHVERTLGGSAAEGALGPAVLGLTMALGRFMGQSVAGRVGDTVIITWGMALAALGAGLAAAAPVPAVAYLGFALMGIGCSVVGPLGLALVGRLVPPAHRATAVARVNVIGFGAFIFAPVVMGQMSDLFGLRLAFVAVGLLALAAPLLARQLRAG